MEDFLMQLFSYSNNFYSNIEVMVYSNGYEDCEPGHFYGPALRKSYMIHHIVKGKGIFKLHEKTYHLSKGDAFLIRPGETVYYEADHENPWSYEWIGMHGAKIDSYLQRTSFAYHPIIHYSKNDRFSLIYAKMEHAYSSNASARDLLMNSVLYELLHFLVIHFPNKRIEKSHRTEEYVDQVIHYCLQNLDKKIKVTDISDYLGLNRSYLTRLFKQQVGSSLKDYILFIKMEEAKKMLKETSLSIQVIARSVGFDNPLYFSRIFHQKEGQTARKYRICHQKKTIIQAD